MLAASFSPRFPANPRATCSARAPLPSTCRNLGRALLRRALRGLSAPGRLHQIQVRPIRPHPPSGAPHQGRPRISSDDGRPGQIARTPRCRERFGPARTAWHRPMPLYGRAMTRFQLVMAATVANLRSVWNYAATATLIAATARAAPGLWEASSAEWASIVSRTAPSKSLNVYRQPRRPKRSGI